MKYSIIIPVYNVADYLEKCVDSALAQTGDFEILLIDDGSTDGLCPALCDRYAARFPQKIRVVHQENGGLGAARNAGIACAEGEYLLFLDSDDTLAPEALGVLERATASNPDMVIFGYEQVFPDGHCRAHPTGLPTDTPLRLATCPQLLISEPNACIRLCRKSLFSDIRFPGRVWYEDLRTTGKLLARANSILAIRDCLYGYLMREGSIMNSRNIARNGEILDAAEDLLTWYRKEGLFEAYETELCALTVEHVLLSASVRVARADAKHPLLAKFSEFTRENFPDYRKNPYRARLSRAKRLALFLMEHRKYRTLRLLFRLKEAM